MTSAPTAYCDRLPLPPRGEGGNAHSHWSTKSRATAGYRALDAGSDRITTFIGIDPGLGGAVAFLDGDELEVYDTPVAVVKGTRREYLVGSMASLLATRTGGKAALEAGIPMPRQATNTTYLMGRGGGLWEGLLAASGMTYDLVPPQRWKKAMGIPPRSDKGASRVLASRLFPACAHLFARVRDDGRAEAALLAMYRKRIG